MTLLKNIFAFVLIVVGLKMLQNDFHFSDHAWWAFYIVIYGIILGANSDIKGK